MRPTIAQTGGPHGPIWCFTTKDNGIARALDRGDRAIATFVPKGHDLLATVYRSPSIDRDRTSVDRLWSRFIAARLEGG
jgi:general stress protein 26